MDNKHTENIKYLCKCIYYSTGLIPYCFYNNQFFYTPQKNNTIAHKVLFGEYQSINVLDRKTKYQIVENDYKEIFYIVSLEELNILIVIGAFLQSEITEGILTNMIRNGIIPFHKKTEIQEYYKSLPIFDDEKTFYISKLIENLFEKTNIYSDNNNNNISNIDHNKDEYFKKLKQNRLDAFSHSSYANELKISQTIKNGDTENAKNILKEINLYPHAKLAVDEIRSYKNSMICSCTFMTRAAISGGVNPNEAFTLSDIYINRIENIQSLNELENFESSMVEGFTDLVNNIKTNKYSRPILNAINYIDKHLCDDIKIKDIAKASYLNPSYLSNLFHKETNIKISDWIMNKRINEAAFSIANTNEEIADIAFLYHFCSQSYFVKCFRKVMGVTPGEYRNNKKSILNSSEIND